MMRPIKNIVLVVLFAGFAALAACSKSGPAPVSAVISVTAGTKPVSGLDDLVTASFTSAGFARHADEALGLTKQWGIPAKDADEKIREAISVRPSGKPDQFIVEASGLDHDVAVKIVNELAAYYCSVRSTVPLEDGKSAVLHASVVTPAK
jgi:hypothetical protein